MPASRATVPPSKPARRNETRGGPHVVPRPASPATGVSWTGLVWTLVRTDFKARYHGTASGFLWALLKPAAMFAVLVTVFSLVFPTEPTYKLDLIVGLFLFDFFTDATKTGMTALSSKAFLLTKARLPRYLLAGCGVVLLYAWIEFPLACPSVLLGFWFNLYAAVRYAALDPGVSAS